MKKLPVFLVFIISYVIFNFVDSAQASIPTYLEKYPAAEAIAPLSRVSLEQIRLVGRDAEVCEKLSVGFDEFVLTLGNGSQSLEAGLKLLAHVNLSCDIAPQKLGELTLKLKTRSPALVWNLFDDEYIKWMVPNANFDLDFLQPESFLQLANWLRLNDELVQQNSLCATSQFAAEKLPEAACFGYWLGWRFKQFIPYDLWKQVSVDSDVAFLSWLNNAKTPVAIFPWYEKIASLNNDYQNAAFPKIIEKLKPENLDWLEAQAGFVNSVASAKHPVIELECKTWLPEAQTLLKSFRKTTPQSLWANVVFLTLKVCADDQKAIQNLEASLPKEKYSIGLELLDELSLGNVQIQSFARDLDLRDGLNLKFAYGSALDAEDLLANPKTSREFIIDSLLFDRLRRADSAPWVRLNEDIEDEVSNELVVRVALAAAATTPSAFSGLFESLYLDAYDRTMLEGTSISTIRTMVTELARELPQARDLAYAVHNSLNRSLVDTARGLTAQISIEELEKFGSKINEIVAALENYFDPQQTPCAEMIKLVTSRNLGLGLGAKVEGFCNASAKTVFESAQEILDSVYEFKSLFLAEYNQNGTDALHSQSAINYVNVLRLRKLAHKHIMTFLSGPTASELPAGSEFYAYMGRYFNIMVNPQRSSVEVMSAVQRQLYEALNPRSQLARWFVLLQSKRIVPNDEYIPSLYTRLYALRFVNEAVLRDQGLFLFAKFDDKNVTSRVLTQGSAYGQLVFVPKAELETHPYRQSEIIVTDGIPLNLGVTAGLVTTVWQGTGSHIDLRTRERGTPNAFKADAATEWESHFTKWVKVDLFHSGIHITPVTEQEALSHVSRPTPLVVPQPAWDVTKLQELDTPQPIVTVGSKAHGFSNLRKLFKSKNYTPPGFAIPFGIYRWFVNEFEIQTDIDKLLAEYKTLDAADLEMRLAAIQDRFEKVAKLDSFVKSKWMTEELLPRLKLLGQQTIDESMADGWNLTEQCFRFRSSTNSEDLLAFTGAGLYESQGGCLNPDKPKKTVARAVAKALGSLWTYRAFAEREYYGIKHADVGMALLVHRNWSDEDINGVMITRSKMDGVYFITAGTDADSATNPAGTVQSTEIQLSLQNGKTMTVNQTIGAVDMSEGERAELASAGEQIWLNALTDYKGFSGLPGLRMDIEFKFQVTSAGVRRLFIKQARPFVGE